jgi:hypothetical protein
MTAASRLQALVDARAGQPDMLKVTVQVGRIIEAVRSTVPQEMWSEIAEKLDDGVCSELVDGTERDDFDDDYLQFEPDFSPDLGDEFEDS